MSQDAVQSALFSAIGTALGAIPAEYENDTLNRPDGSRWARVSYSPAQPVPDTLGVNGVNKLIGFAQVLLHYPQGKGWKASNVDCTGIETAFTTGRKLLLSGQETVIQSCGRNAGYKAGNWYIVPVTITWYAFIQR